MPTPSNEEWLSILACEILEVTQRYQAGDCSENDLPTAADLARQHRWRLDAVKKRLRTLKESGLIRAVTVTPKRYCFDTWALGALDATHPMYQLFCEPESPYFLEYPSN